MTVEAVLERLQRVRKTGRDSWIASAPTREDKRPSLTIRALPDGRVLLHDFGGDDVESILAAIGLGFDDLFPPRAVDHRIPPERHPCNARDVLRCVALEVTVAKLCSNAMRSGEALSDTDHERLGLAMSRLLAAEELVNGA